MRVIGGNMALVHLWTPFAPRASPMAFVRLLPAAPPLKSHLVDRNFHWNILATVYWFFFLTILGSVSLQIGIVIPIACSRPLRSWDATYISN